MLFSVNHPHSNYVEMCYYGMWLLLYVNIYVLRYG